MKVVQSLMVYISLIAFNNVIYSQNFSWQVGDTAILAQPLGEFEIKTILLNNTNEAIQLQIVRLINPDLTGWQTSLCVGEFCAAPFVDTLQIEIEANETGSLKLIVITGSDPASTTITVKVENVTNLSELFIQVFSVNTSITHLDSGETSVSSTFSLYPNFPNPFNPSTTINFRIDVDREIKTELTIFNQIGQKIRTLVDTELYPGFYYVQWDGKNSHGNAVSSGSYLYKLRVGDQVLTRRMILAK